MMDEKASNQRVRVVVGADLRSAWASARRAAAAAAAPAPRAPRPSALRRLEPSTRYLWIPLSQLTLIKL